MASNFRITTSRCKSDVHLRLSGDFDGTSAFELIYALKERCAGTTKAFIHTDGLKRIHTFGKDVLCNNLSLLNGQDIHLAFCGRNAAELAPERNKFL
jgi:anti-anti-sigma regulatory factor